jgi:hypothetical protein
MELSCGLFAIGLGQPLSIQRPKPPKKIKSFFMKRTTSKELRFLPGE